MEASQRKAEPVLRSLDLGGNPCSRDVEGYKFRVVRVLSRLKTLDGDHITQLDKDLTEEFFASQQKRQSNNGFIGARPFTAPAAPGVRGSLLDTDVLTPNSIDPFASNLMPRGNVRLFRDDFLNNNPILLEYMAENANRAPFVDESINPTNPNETDESVPAVSTFVDKMRNANRLPNHDMENIDTEREATLITSDLNKMILSPSVSTSNLGVDPSDPSITIRKLLKHIEESLARYKNHQLDAVSQSLLQENKQLQTENNNIPILQEQIQDLKKQLATLESDPSTTRMLETNRVKSLQVLPRICCKATNTLQD
ncbi:unnamed protein product [Phytophthora fragariaefolia]|uniref:Unnamed protein product n=1 Tax=Phytophthora fragariaefolia TaxID=1490495 RepID=A0A9W6XML6_9STRA|nr:unnamed protein product [Phytophthora fragariaefolia]